jgi:hypothetical protein
MWTLRSTRRNKKLIALDQLHIEHLDQFMHSLGVVC